MGRMATRDAGSPDDGYVYGPSGYTRHYVREGYIYGPQGYTQYYFTEHSIYGPKNALPWLDVT